MGLPSPFTSAPLLRSKVVLRPSTPHDRDQLITNINSIAAEQIYLQTTAFTPDAVWDAAIREGDNPRAGQLVLLPVVNGKAIGYLRIFPGNYGERNRHVASIGLGLLPEYRGKGIGSSLMSQALQWAPSAGFEKLEAQIIATNWPSRRLFAKFNFVVEGVRRCQLRIRDELVDELVVSLLLRSEPSFHSLKSFQNLTLKGV